MSVAAFSQLLKSYLGAQLNSTPPSRDHLDLKHSLKLRGVSSIAYASVVSKVEVIDLCELQHDISFSS